MFALLFAASLLFHALVHVGKRMRKRRSSPPRCKSMARLDGKTALVTGAESGLGLEVAGDLAARGARVVLACRDMAKGTRALVHVATEGKNPDVALKHLDLSDVDSVRNLAQYTMDSEGGLDVLVLNGEGPNSFLGKALLVRLLIPLVAESAAGNKTDDPGRIVLVAGFNDRGRSSDVAKMSRSDSRLANFLFAKELAQRLDGANVIVNVADTAVSWPEKLLPGLFSKAAAKETVVWLSVDRQLVSRDIRPSGQCFDDVGGDPAPVEAAGDASVLAEALWRRTANVLGLEEDEILSEMN